MIPSPYFPVWIIGRLGDDAHGVSLCGKARSKLSGKSANAGKLRVEVETDDEDFQQEVLPAILQFLLRKRKVALYSYAVLSIIQIRVG
jgi:hypothetical protein